MMGVHQCCRTVFVACLMVSGNLGAALGQDAIAPDILQRLKQATVFVKVAVGPLNWSGSGFVIQGDGQTGYLVTNAHVVTKPNLSAAIPFPFGLRGRDAFELRKLQTEIQTLDVEITTVFRSGTPQEATHPAVVVAVDEQRDLAVLRVADLMSIPTPVPIDPQFHPVETTPVFTFGFPFGEALSQSKGNPAITVGRGTVSSLRLDEDGAESKVQIDGALNPGNSGGPVVDAQGRLVGVAVSTIKGAGIGFAVPPSALKTLLTNRASDLRISQRADSDGVAFDIELKLFDPQRQIARVTVHCLPRAVEPAEQPLDASHSVDLERAEHRARGVWRLPKETAAPTVVSLQPAITDREGHTTYLAVSQHKFTASAPLPERRTSRPPRPPVVRPTAVPTDRKVLRSAVQNVGELTLSGGTVVVDRRSPVIGLGLTEPTVGQRAVTYFALYRLPSGEIQRTSSVARIQRTGEQARLVYGAFLDDLELLVEHTVTPAGREIQHDVLTLQGQVFDPMAGRLFLVDLRTEPPKIVQKKTLLPDGPMGDALDDAVLLEWCDRTIEHVQKTDPSVATFRGK